MWLIGWKVPTGTSQTGSMLVECSLGTHLNFAGEIFIFGIFTFFEEMTFWCPKDEDLRTEAWMVFQSKPGTKLKSCRWNLYILEFLHFSRLLFDSAFPTLVWIVESLQIILMLLQLPQPMMFAWMVPVRMINFYCLEEEGG